MNNRILITLVVILGLLSGVTNSHSQNRFTITSTSAIGTSHPSFGRDFWFGIPQNYDKNQFGAKYSFFLFISSAKNTTVNIQDPVLGLITRSILANQVLSLSSERGEISESQITSSGKIETKSFHIWSEDADLSVEFISRAIQTTDGMYCIPVNGWGKEYVVASYNAYPIAQPDLPSEFMIVANENNTVVTITPTDTIRKDGSPTVGEHPKGTPFSITLQKGELIQFQTKAPGIEGSDLTGTYITSTKPIGVIGASVCPNVPVSDASCDHLLEMLQPTRCWGVQYLSAPFAGRKFGGDLFLVVGTKPNQIILRNGVQVAVLGLPFDYFFFYDINEPSNWTSNDPFMLVQYIQGSTHGVPSPSQRNLGDPSMMVINAINQYSSSIQFNIPKGLGFTHYVNILVPTSHEAATTIDGKPLNSLPSGFQMGGTIGGVVTAGRRPIPGTVWETILLVSTSTAAEGSHTIQSDTVIEACLYGYSKDDSYAIPAHLGTATSFSTDTIPPKTQWVPKCFCGVLTLTDDGLLATGLSAIALDSVYNMAFVADSTFVFGDDSMKINICLIDSSKEGILTLSATDIAGNISQVTIAAPADSTRLVYNSLVGKEVKGGIEDTLQVVIHNATISTIDLSYISLTQGSAFFKLITPSSVSISANSDIIIKVVVTIPDSTSATAVLNITEGCYYHAIGLSALSGNVSFVVQGHDFNCIPVGTSKDGLINIMNVSTFSNIVIDSIWSSLPSIFKYSGAKLPIEIAPEKSQYITVQFTASSIFDTTATLFVRTTTGKIQTAAIHGCALASSVKENVDVIGFTMLPVVPNPANMNKSLSFGYSLAKATPLTLELFDELGNKVAILLSIAHHPEGSFVQNLELPQGLAAGAYYYRYLVGNERRTGKLIISN